VRFAPHTTDDITAMLDVVGQPDLDALFSHIPEELRVDGPLQLPQGRSEDEVLRVARDFASRNDTDAVCFAGGGAYDHHVPSLIGALISRGELLTAYTPYQPEVSQGMLQALFEYQTVISELTGLPISNASLYDGGSAVAEAVSMACAATRRNRVVLAQSLDAPSREVARTYGHPLGRRFDEAPTDAASGTTPVIAVDDDVAAVVVQQPNALGVIEDVRAWAQATHASGAMLIVKLDPLATGLLARPGDQGADIVIGEGQTLGQGLSYGGPAFGFLACRDDQVRRLPGRVVGQTVDAEGTRGYVMTLRAREQDIRREKATSNICTNQTLNAVAALIYLSWLGPEGLAQLAHDCFARAQHAVARLTAVPGVTTAVEGPWWREFPLKLDVPDPHEVIRALAGEGFLIGPVVPDGPAAGAVLIALTERRTAEEVEALAVALERVVSESQRRIAGAA